MNKLQGQTVVIIGGSSGMGLGAAQAAAAEGATVVIASHSQDKLDKALEQINGHAKALQLDILDRNSIRQLFEEVGQLDHLFITAAPGSRGKFLDSIDSARQYMEGKFWGSYTCAYYAAPKMSERGSITFITGGLSRRPQPGASIVTASQCAVEGLAKALAVELAPLRFNVVLPGAIDTSLWDFMPEDEREEFLQQAAQVPAGRIGQPEDIGSAAVFLMTQSFITGAVLEVNGGNLLI
ncbi:MAG: SDR family oxidoreductase [Cyanophyceae cyanobacterium]